MVPDAASFWLPCGATVGAGRSAACSEGGRGIKWDSARERMRGTGEGVAEGETVSICAATLGGRDSEIDIIRLRQCSPSLFADALVRFKASKVLKATT